VPKPVEIVESFFQSLRSRDMDKILSFFDERSSWQNVPHPAAKGVAEIDSMFKAIVNRSSRIQWDIVTEAYDEKRAWLERIDRFWVDGNEYAVRCNGVFEFDLETGTIISVRDYVDLNEWRGRLSVANL